MSHAALKYVEPTNETSDTLVFERRVAQRHTAKGRVTAIQFAGNPATENNRIFSMDLIDISESGLGALINEPLTTGSRIRVCFTPHGAEHGFDMSGLVVRCTCRAHGHEIGIRFNNRSAA